MVQTISSQARVTSFGSLGRAISLWRVLVAQDIAVRYRGTLLGRAWPLLTPLLMVAVYGFVFGAVFRARWPGVAEDDHLGFALTLYIGLLVHAILAETVGQAPGLMLRHSNFVRKVVFPLPVLVAAPLGTAVLHGAIGLVLVWAIACLAGSGWESSVLAAPIILAPYLLLLYGLALALAALGVYLRDLGQVANVLVMVILFTGAVFYPRAMVPPALSVVIDWNPIVWPIQALRDCLLHGLWPDPLAWSLYSLTALVVLACGWMMFGVLKRGFADLL